MSLKTKVLKGLFFIGLLAVTPVSAHHVFSAEYDANKPVKLHGTLTKISWINPHSWIYIEAKDASGNLVNWTIEFGSPNQLSRRGFKKADLQVGVTLDIFAYLSKSKSDVAIAHNVKLPDGREFYVGGDGAGVPDAKAGTSGAAASAKTAE